MSPDLKIIEVDPHAMSPEGWRALHAFRRKRHLEVDPSDHYDSDEVFEGTLRYRDLFHWYSWYMVMSADGEVIGFLTCWAPQPGTPEYETNGHLIEAEASVLVEHRRSGIATALLRTLVARGQSAGATTVVIWVTEDSGREFLTKRGFTTGLGESLSRLDVGAVDWPMLHRWIAEGTERNEGVQVEIHADRLPEDLLDEYCPVYTALHNDMPLEDLNAGDEVYTPERMRNISRWLDATAGFHHTCFTRQPTGEISALTDVVYRPSSPAHLHQWATGVVPRYRGSGLGKFVKAKMLVWVTERHPEIKWVLTENAGSNDAMLGINRAMGFVHYRSQTAMQTPLVALKSLIDGTGTL
ncbi:MAG: N-acetyltransferase family protein [Actinomycetota bacterium]|nr:GNAT family N-acetyltransferase [Actinomycetota bacterium]